MSRKLSLAVTLLTFVSFPFSNAALASMGNNSTGVADILKQASPIEKTQYYSFEDDNYCWYDEGWSGPGWYWCDYEWENGIGWGGPYDWNGWRGGGRFRSHHAHGVGTWHAGPPNNRLGFGGDRTIHNFGGGGFRGGLGGRGFHGGFGGGGSFPSGGHGGGGHR